MNNFSILETNLRTTLDNVTGKVLGTQSRLAALEKHLQDLSRGRHGVLLHPHPQVNHFEDFLTMWTTEVTLKIPHCSAYMEGFHHGDVLLCSCMHMYHPWCAGQWFRVTSLCAHRHCGEVHSMWLKSWDFPFAKAPVGVPEDDVHLGGKVRVIGEGPPR